MYINQFKLLHNCITIVSILGILSHQAVAEHDWLPACLPADSEDEAGIGKLESDQFQQFVDRLKDRSTVL